MDPITHTLTGAALARAGLDRVTPLATAALILAANAPDVDMVAYVNGEYAALAFRRGWTHGPLAMIVLPFVVAGLLAFWDHAVRRRRADAAPARFRGLLLVSFLGVLTHPMLDWLNTYGIRLLMPFDDRWFYGDALFIIDPWVWLALGLAVFWRRTRVADGRGIARAAGSVAIAYVLAMIVASRAAEAVARRDAIANGIQPVREVMFQPSPANPFTGSLVVVTEETYHRGSFDWRRGERASVSERGSPRGVPKEAVDALDDARVRDFLTWSRFPYFRVDIRRGGRASAWFGDMRYVGDARVGSLAGIRVELGPAGLRGREGGS